MGTITIYFRCDIEDARAIMCHVGIDESINVNGETAHPVSLDDDQMTVLREYEKQGFIQLRRK